MDFYEIGIVQCFKDVINFFKFKRAMKSEFYRRDLQDPDNPPQKFLA